jgi:hypothetical protein
VGRVVQQGQVVAIRDLLQSQDITSLPPQMHPDDRAGIAGNELFDPRRVDGVGVRLDIAEDGPQPLPLKRMRRRDEGERGNNHFAFKPGRIGGQLQANRAVANGKAVFDLQHLGDSALEGPHRAAVVGQPAAIKYVVDLLEEMRPITNVRTPHMQMGVECWRAAK